MYFMLECVCVCSCGTHHTVRFPYDNVVFIKLSLFLSHRLPLCRTHALRGMASVRYAHSVYRNDPKSPPQSAPKSYSICPCRGDGRHCRHRRHSRSVCVQRERTLSLDDIVVVVTHANTHSAQTHIHTRTHSTHSRTRLIKAI